MTRCEHGFIRGLCRDFFCEHFEGYVTAESALPCQSCGAPATAGMCAHFLNEHARYCSSCIAARHASNKRRKGQNAWL